MFKRQSTTPIDSSQHTSNLDAVSSSLLALILPPLNLSDYNICATAPQNELDDLL